MEDLRNDLVTIEGRPVVATTMTGLVVGHALLTRCRIDGVPEL